MDNQRPYFSYMLRMWLSLEAQNPIWRASLENPHTGERLTFKNLDRLFTFLEDQCTAKDSDKAEGKAG